MEEGHDSGAVKIRWEEFYANEGQGRLKTPAELRKVFERAGVADQTVVTYCAVGMRASLAYFAARAAGLPVLLYQGSMNDWESRPGAPIVNRGALPLGLPDTLSRAPLRGRAPFAWLARCRSFAQCPSGRYVSRKRHHRVHAHRPPRRQVAGEERHRREHAGHGRERGDVPCVHVVEEGLIDPEK